MRAELALSLLQMEPATKGDAVSAESSTTSKLTEKVFEIKAVDKEASSLLETVDEINGQLDAARELRMQQCEWLSIAEERLVENAFESTERALADVTGLVEPCRVSTKLESGDIGLVFVLRASPRASLTLNELGLASQRLQTALNVLCRRGDSPQASTSRPPLDSKPPPTYEESQFLTESLTRNMLRRASSDLPPVAEGEYERRRPSSNLGRLLEHGELDESQHPRAERDELFFDSSDIGSPGLSPTHTYIPYKPGIASPSMSSLGSRASTPGVLLPGLPYPDFVESGGISEASARSRGLTYPTLPHQQIAMRHEAIRHGAQSPAVSVVDGFEETQRRMEERPSLERSRHTASWSAYHRPQLSEYGIPSWSVSRQYAHRVSAPAAQQHEEVEAQPGNLPLRGAAMRSGPQIWSRSSMPAIPTCIPIEDPLLSRPPLRAPPPIPMPSFPDDAGAVAQDELSKHLELPQHVTSHEPALSPTDLSLSMNADSTREEATANHFEGSPKPMKDWETLPSQVKRETAKATFVVTCDSSELAPKPLFHSMVKLDVENASGSIQQSPVTLARKPVPASPTRPLQPSLESEFPEVVTIDTVAMAIHPPSPGSQLPELAIQPSNGRGAMTVVTGVSKDILKRTRTQRQRDARVRGDDAPELALRSPRENAPELVTKAASIGKRPPPIPPKPRRNGKASSAPSLPSAAALSIPDARPPTPTKLEPFSGRARGQRWRELQFERSQLLPNSLS